MCAVDEASVGVGSSKLAGALVFCPVISRWLFVEIIDCFSFCFSCPVLLCLYLLLLVFILSRLLSLVFLYKLVKYIFASY